MTKNASNNLSTSIKKILAVFFFIIISFLFVVGSFPISGLVFFLLLNLLIGVFIQSPFKIDFSISFSTGVLIVFFFYWYWSTFYGIPYLRGSKTDDWMYDMVWAKNYYITYGINPFKLKDSLGILFNSPGYVYLLALFRNFSSYFGEYSTMIPRMFNVFVLSLTALYGSKCYGLCNKKKNINGSKKVFYIIALFPSLIFFASHVFRDIIVGFCIVNIFYLVLKSKKHLWAWLFIVLELFILFTLRKSSFLLTFGIIPIVLIKPNKWKYYLPFFIIAMVVAFSTYFQGALSLSERLAGSYAELNTERMGTIGSAIFSLPLYLGFIPRVIYLVFIPVPQLSSFYQFFVSIGTWFQIIYFPFLFWGIFNKRIDSRLKIVYLLFFLGVAMTSASFRHTTMYLPLGIVLLMTQLRMGKMVFNWKYFLTLGGLILTFIGSLALAL